MSKSTDKPGPLKIAIAVVSIAGALATVAHHGGLIDLAGGEVEAKTEEPDGPRPIPLEDASPAPIDLDPAAPNDAPLLELTPSGDAPDWRGMFDTLMAREEQRRAELSMPREADDDGGAAAAAEAERERAEEAARAASEAERRAAEATAGLAGLALRGTLSVDGQGVALVDGRLVRVGDVVPGTSARVVAVRRDRIQLSHPDLDGDVELHLAPLERPGADAGDTTSAVSGETADEPADPAPATPASDDG